MRGIFAACLAGAVPSTLAQSSVRQFYSDFDEGLPAGSEVRGNAAWSATGGGADSGVVKLTEAVSGQIGSLVVGDFAGGGAISNFWARFRVRVGGGTGADGFSFNVAPDLSGAFGEEGVSGGFSVSFDTFQNQGEETPDITLRLDNLPPARSSFPVRTDQEFVPVEVLVTRLGGPPPVASIFTRFQVYYRQTNVISHTISGWISFPPGTQWGLGARTGAVTDNHWIDDLLILANYTFGPAVVVVQPPANTSVQYGRTVRLNVVADGTPPLNYQWLRDGVDIPGATEPAYITPPMDFALDGARYAVRVSNGRGTNVSAAATVIRQQATVHSWPLARGYNLISTPVEVGDGGDGTIGSLWSAAPHGATFWKFENASQSWRSAEIFVAGQGWRPGTTRLAPGEGGWFYSPQAFSLVATGRVVQPQLPAGLAGSGWRLRGSPLPVPAGYSDIFAGSPADGLLVHRWNPASQSFFPPWVHDLGQWLPGPWEAAAGEGVFFLGPGSGPFPSTPNAPPSITAISNLTVFTGQTAGPLGFRVLDADHPTDALLVTASSSNTSLLPQANISFGGGGENRTLTLILAAGAVGRANVTLTVSDPLGASSSTQFTLRVVSTNGPPVFVLDPVPVDLASGQTLRLEAEADGAPTITYLWRRNGALLRHETNRILVITNAQPTDGGTYSAVAFNALGAAASDRAVVRVDAASAVPMTNSVAEAALAEGEAGRVLSTNRDASTEPGEPQHAGKPGGHSVWFKWRPGRSGIATFDTLGSSFDTLLAVYTGTVFTGLQEVVGDDDGDRHFNSRVRFNAEAGTTYLVAVDGFFGEAGDIVLQWSLLTGTSRLPMIRRHPEGVAAPPRTTVTFAVEVADPVPQELRHQWFHNGAGALAGQTNTSLLLTQLNAGHLGTYRVEVIRGTVTNTSREAVLELATSPAIPTFDKLGDAFTAAAPVNQPGLQARRRLASGASVSVGIPGSRLIPNNTGETEGRENYNCAAVIGRSRWIPLEIPSEGTLVVDAHGSSVDTVAELVRWHGDPNRGDPVTLACKGAGVGAAMGLLVATNIAAGSDYFLVVDRVITAGSLNAPDGPIHVNWAFLHGHPELSPTWFTEGDLRAVEPLARGLVGPWNELLDYLGGRLDLLDAGARPRLSNWLASTNRMPADVAGILLAGLDGWVAGELIWETRRFNGVVLDLELSQRVSMPFSTDGERQRVNRLLLEAAFPTELNGSREPRLRVWQSLAVPGETHLRLVDDPVNAWRVEETSALSGSVANPGWLAVTNPAVTAQFNPALWLKIIRPPSGVSSGPRFYRAGR